MGFTVLGCSLNAVVGHVHESLIEIEELDRRDLPAQLRLLDRLNGCRPGFWISLHIFRKITICFLEDRLLQVEEQLAQVSDDAAEGADGVFLVDALRAEIRRLEGSVSELSEERTAQLQPSTDEIESVARAAAEQVAHAAADEMGRLHGKLDALVAEMERRDAAQSSAVAPAAAPAPGLSANDIAVAVSEHVSKAAVPGASEAVFRRV